jgi:hypothetical protein
MRCPFFLFYSVVLPFFCYAVSVTKLCSCSFTILLSQSVQSFGNSTSDKGYKIIIWRNIVGRRCFRFQGCKSRRCLKSATKQSEFFSSSQRIFIQRIQNVSLKDRCQIEMLCFLFRLLNRMLTFGQPFPAFICNCRVLPSGILYKSKDIAFTMLQFPLRLPGFKPRSVHVGFCDGQKWGWGRFSPRTSVSPGNLHSICFSTIIFNNTRSWHNRPGVAAVPIASQTK